MMSVIDFDSLEQHGRTKFTTLKANCLRTSELQIPKYTFKYLKIKSYHLVLVLIVYDYLGGPRKVHPPYSYT